MNRSSAEIYQAKKRIIVLDGPDRCGKTHIGLELARRTGWTYFKNDAERENFGSDNEANYFTGVLRYGLPFLTSFFRQSPYSVILDRCYPTEFVYSKVFERSTDENMLVKADHEFQELGANIFLLRRHSYDGLIDDTHPHRIDSQMLVKIDMMYDQFKNWTRVPVHTIYVDDENLDREVNEIMARL